MCSLNIFGPADLLLDGETRLSDHIALGDIRRECVVNHLEIQSHDLEETLIGFFDGFCPAERETPKPFPWKGGS